MHGHLPIAHPAAFDFFGEPLVRLERYDRGVPGDQMHRQNALSVIGPNVNQHGIGRHVLERVQIVLVRLWRERHDESLRGFRRASAERRVVLNGPHELS